MDPVNESTADNGILVPRRRFRLSWVWLFPIMALTAVGVMYFKQWRNEGPEIYVEFASAPGMKGGKTPLFYRGVEAGLVSDVKLSKDLSKVLVKVRLHSHAADLAREGTLFWIDQPVFNLTKPSGIESLIEGNSLQAKKGSGNPCYYFLGSNEIPVDPLEDDSLCIRLSSSSLPLLEAGAEVMFRGLSVGSVRSRGIDDNGTPYLEIGFPKRYAGLVRSNARFWELIPWSMKIGSGVFELDVSSLKTFLIGGLAFDYFGPRGEEVASGKVFPVFSDEETARAVSEPVTLEFKNGQGIQAGMTQLRYLGQPVGIVESVKAMENKVMITARFREGYDFLRARGAVFSIVRPRIELQKVSGLETIVSGVYIECIPGSGGSLLGKFRGTDQEDANLLGESIGKFEVRLTSASCKLSPGTPVLYRGLKVGTIIRKGLSKDGTGVLLTASIDNQYAGLLRENTRFWNISGVKISGGLINLNVQATAFESKGLGGVEFATPAGDAGGEPVEKGHTFELYDSPRKEWLLWTPPTPVPR
jgi:paraquat-inducible protein B